MNIFGVGLPEMILILAVALLVFGPKRLPEIGRTIAKTLKMLQDASKEFETELKKEADSISAIVEEKPQPAKTEAMSAAASPPEATLPNAEDETKTSTSKDADQPETTANAAEITSDNSEAASETPNKGTVDAVEDANDTDGGGASSSTPPSSEEESELHGRGTATEAEASQA